MRKRKAAIKKGYVAIEIRSSMYDEEESLFIERMMSKQYFGKLIEYICACSEPKRNQKPKSL